MTQLNLSIQIVKQQFAFLETCGYVIEEGFAPPSLIDFRKNFVIKYRKFHKQVEIAIAIERQDISIFVMNMINNHAVYNDHLNFLNVIDLRFLKSTNIIDLANFSVRLAGYERAIVTYANLVKESQDIICNDTKWFDVNLIENKKNLYYAQEMGVVPKSINRTERVGAIFLKKMSFLLDEGYHVMENSDTLPPYQYSDWHLLYSDGENIIRIQQDLREFYYTMYFNKKSILDVRVDKYQSINEMADHFVYIVKELL